MTPAAPATAPVIEWATAGAPLAGELESGDLPVVAPFPDGALVALIDGLGHGPEAAAAARVAAELLTTYAGEPPASLLQRCHEGLRKTRGAVMSVASFDARDSVLTWSGVGNIEGILIRGDTGVASESIARRGGVVGYQMPPLRTQVLPVARGDTLILVTDGVRNDFRAPLGAASDPQEIADTILAGYGKVTDDACVVVARYLAPSFVSVPVREDSDVVMARTRVREQAYKAGLLAADVEALATAVTEIARNVVVHAAHGDVQIAFAEEGARSGLVVVVRDEGPGIADPERALRGDHSTAGGLGLGLSSARRLVDELELSTLVGRGTTVTMKKWRR